MNTKKLLLLALLSTGFIFKGSLNAMKDNDATTFMLLEEEPMNMNTESITTVTEPMDAPMILPYQEEDAQEMFIMAPVEDTNSSSAMANQPMVIEEYTENITIPTKKNKTCCPGVEDPYAPCDLEFEKEIRLQEMN